MRAIAHGLLMAMLITSTGADAATAPPVRSACDAPEYHQFDFWLGHWQVVAAADNATALGASRIERGSSGCWITEHWRGAGGVEGTSLNAWDAAHHVWRQFWTGSDGIVLRLEGGLHDGAMVLEGTLPRRTGGEQRQRITWTPRSDGSVTQHWETSDDEGAHWATSFLGIYRRQRP
jgi:hypothetical protein